MILQRIDQSIDRSDGLTVNGHSDRRKPSDFRALRLNAPGFDLFVHCLEDMRRRFELCVYGYL